MGKIGFFKDSNIFWAGVDNSQMEGSGYMRIMEMLQVCMDIMAVEHINEQDIVAQYPFLGLSFVSKNRIKFLPQAAPLDHEDLKFLYKLQIFA